MVKIQFRNLILKIDFLVIEKIIQASSRENENLLQKKVGIENPIPAS